MTLDAATFKKIAPSMRRALLLAGTGLLLLGGILFFAILPALKHRRVLITEMATLKTTRDAMRGEIANTARQEEQNRRRAEALQAILDRGVLTPLLNSYAMRGKSLLDPIAEQTGFAITGVKDSRFLRLQVPQPTPLQLYGRQLIEFTGQGAYTSIVSFVTQVEAALPLCTLSAIKILGQTQNPETHRAFITFEWPAKGEKRSAP